MHSLDSHGDMMITTDAGNFSFAARTGHFVGERRVAYSFSVAAITLVLVMNELSLS